MKRTLTQLKKKGGRYWIGAAIATILGILVGHLLSEHNVWLQSRYALYHAMQHTLSKQPYDQNTFVVTIGDDEYWKGPFQRRVPIRRDLLAKLVDKLSEARAKVIALDFDLRSPMPDGSIRESPAYQCETDKLLTAIRRACANHRLIVLPATIAYDKNNEYVLASDIYTRALLPNSGVLTGYIALPTDSRSVQLEITLANKRTLESLALAAAGAYDQRSRERVGNRKIFPFGGYLKPNEFLQLSAGNVLSMDVDSLSKRVEGKLVFIGGAWHRLAWETGPLNDVHPTPVGPIPGVFVHANYAEAILDNDVFPVREWIGLVLELLVLMATVIVLALEISAKQKLGLLIAASFIFIVAGYVLLQNLGIYFDFFVPLVFLLIHVGLHKVIEWRNIALSREA